MSPMLTEFGLDHLSPDVWRALARVLWDSAGDAQPLSAEVAEMIDRRTAEFVANPDDVIPAHEVHAAIPAKHGWKK